MGWGGWIYFFGAIASTIYAYNMSSWLAEQAFLSMVPASVADYVEYANDYLPAIAKKFYKKVMIVQSIVETIVLFGGNLFFLWLFNTLLLQLLITWECRRFNLTTMDISARNALAGSISASVLLLIWNIITIIPFPITKILVAIEGFPFIGWMIIPAILLIFNLSFGAIGKAVALAQGCAPTPAPTTTESFTNSLNTNLNTQCYSNHQTINNLCNNKTFTQCKSSNTTHTSQQISPLRNQGSARMVKTIPPYPRTPCKHRLLKINKPLSQRPVRNNTIANL